MNVGSIPAASAKLALHVSTLSDNSTDLGYKVGMKQVIPSRTPEYRSLYNKQRNKKLFEERRASLIALLGGRCVICESTKDLQFDHKDPSQKKFKVACSLGRSMTALLEEASKCQLLCVECHRKKTSRERWEKAEASLKHGTLNAYYKHGCRCNECRKARSAHYFATKQ